MAVSDCCGSIGEKEEAAECYAENEWAPHHLAPTFVDLVFTVDADAGRWATLPLLGEALLAPVHNAHFLVAAALFAVVDGTADEFGRVWASSDAAYVILVLNIHDLLLHHHRLTWLLDHLLLHNWLTWHLDHLNLRGWLCLNNDSGGNLVWVHRG